MNARPGAQAVGLKVVVGGAAPPEIGNADYGQVTPYVNVTAGSGSLAISGLSGSAGGSGAQTTQDLVDGKRYTAVALAKGSKGFQIKVYTDGDAMKKTARLRVIHAAPELGSPDIKLGQRTIAEKVGYTDASPYLTVAPGSYQLAVVKPGGSSPVFAQRISLSAGAATTAILAGSGGAQERLIVASDQTVTPAGAPETGLGGLASGGGGSPWLFVALAALFAGTLGGVIQLSLARRR